MPALHGPHKCYVERGLAEAPRIFSSVSLSFFLVQCAADGDDAEAGLSTEISFSFSMGGSAIGVVGTMLSWITMTVSILNLTIYLTDRFQYVGRRKIMLYGLSTLSAILLLVGFLEIPAKHGNTNVAWGQAVLIMIWIFVYDFTVGPVAYCVAGEVSSARLRGKTVGLARNAYNIWGVVAGVIQPYMLNPLAWNWDGYSGSFWVSSSTRFRIALAE